MIALTIRRDAHSPKGCSGGSSAVICRRVTWLTVAAVRDRTDPREFVGRVAGGDVIAVTPLVQRPIATFVNGKV